MNEYFVQNYHVHAMCRPLCWTQGAYKYGSLTLSVCTGKVLVIRIRNNSKIHPNKGRIRQNNYK